MTANVDGHQFLKMILVAESPQVNLIFSTQVTTPGCSMDTTMHKKPTKIENTSTVSRIIPS